MSDEREVSSGSFRPAAPASQEIQVTPPTSAISLDLRNLPPPMSSALQSSSAPASPLPRPNDNTISPSRPNVDHGRANTPVLPEGRIPPASSQQGIFSGPGGLLSPNSLGSAASFVFPVRSMFTSMSTGGSGQLHPPLMRHSSGGQIMPSSPISSQQGSMAIFGDNERDRSGSISTTASGGMSIRDIMSQGDSIAQMMLQAANSSSPISGSAHNSVRRASGGAQPLSRQSPPRRNAPKLSPVLSDQGAERSSGSGTSSDKTKIAGRVSKPRMGNFPSSAGYGPMTAPLTGVPESSESPFFTGAKGVSGQGKSGSSAPRDAVTVGTRIRERRMSVPPSSITWSGSGEGPMRKSNPMSEVDAVLHGFHDPNTYILSAENLPALAAQSPPSQQDERRDSLHAEKRSSTERPFSERHAGGQVDLVRQETKSIQQATTSRGEDHNGRATYTFRDRPGALNSEEAKDKPKVEIQAPQPSSADTSDGLEDVTHMADSAGPSRDADEKKQPTGMETGGGRVVRDQTDQTSDEPAVGAAISGAGAGGENREATNKENTSNTADADGRLPPSDIQGIVRLGPPGDVVGPPAYGSGSAGNSAGSAGERASALLSPSSARVNALKKRGTVDHQSSVQRFVDNQADTENMLDPNAPTPVLTPMARSAGSGDISSSGNRIPSNAEDMTPEDGDGITGQSASEEGEDNEDTSTTDPEVSGSQEASVRGSLESSDLTGSKDESEPVMTVRFEHITTNDGHHVVVGREGKLEKCEDEPITTPGAVQGFGVLLVLEENEDTGDLSVRQISENSTELLGLSPRYLFRLQCFSHILPRSQDDTLRDNIDYLPDPDYQGNDGEENDGPQVFLLSGYGEPGSDDTDETPSARTVNRRREWTCWVAAHRPSQKSWNRVDQRGRPIPPPNLIVLEFELEGDPYNPLYPPMKTAEPSGAESPGSGSGATATASEAAFFAAASAHSSSAGEATDPSAITSGTSTATDSTINGGNTANTKLTDPEEGRRLMGLEGNDVFIDPADILESTTSRARPLRALERMRRMTRTAMISGAQGGDYIGQPNIGANPNAGSARRRNRRAGAGAGGVGTMDVFAVLAQINDQLGSAADLETFLKIVVGVIKDLTQFHRCLVYSFDPHWNGQVVAELVDWSKTHDLYKGLMFPMTDIPAQARELYRINKVRLLYDREQPTARMVLRTKDDLEFPLDMTHSYLRSMSPIHLVYLRNMGVRSSMSVSIMAFGSLWGLIACHAYGDAGMRVSFPVRQMLKLLSDSISRNIERLSYAARLRSRKLISTIPTDLHPTGYIVSNADDLIQLFDADSGVLVIGDGAKILGPTTEHGQEILLIAEFLRLKRYEQMQISHNILDDFPELRGPRAPEMLSGLLYVPLSSGGRDYICFLRKGQARNVHWAGKPYKEGKEAGANLEPRQSFKVWSETIKGRARDWTDEQMETAGVLALVYGKFIEVWRQKESAIRTNQMTSILLNNASHEVRTPLNHIINYLELALEGHLDPETRENLSRSHVASKSLLFTINDLLDLTRIESGNEISFSDPFDIRQCVEDATNVYRGEANRKGLDFVVNTSDAPEMLVIGDLKKIRTVVANLVANAVKYTATGTVQVICRCLEKTSSSVSTSRGGSVGTGGQYTEVELIISDTGAGIPSEKLEAMFVTFEQADSANTQPGGLGLGLAVVARIVEQLGGQLRAESEIGVGTRFYVSLHMAAYVGDDTGSSVSAGGDSVALRRPGSNSSSGGGNSVVSASNQTRGAEIDTFVEAFGQSHMTRLENDERVAAAEARMRQPGTFPVADSSYPVRARRMDVDDAAPWTGSSHTSQDAIMPDEQLRKSPEQIGPPTQTPKTKQGPSKPAKSPSKSKSNASAVKLRILVVEDDDVNRKILERRLRIDGHTVLSDTNGQEAVDRIMKDQNFDCILMDIQMPVMDGQQSAQAIRKFEETISGSLAVETAVRRVDGHIPIVAVSATLLESQKDELGGYFDGWILKPVDFKRMLQLLSGLSNIDRRKLDVYKKGCWEHGGWLNAVLDDRSRRISESAEASTPKVGTKA